MSPFKGMQCLEKDSVLTIIHAVTHRDVSVFEIERVIRHYFYLLIFVHRRHANFHELRENVKSKTTPLYVHLRAWRSGTVVNFTVRHSNFSKRHA